MKYCHISFAVCFMSLSSLAFSGIYPDLPDVGVSAQVRECSDFFSGSCLSIKKQNSLRVVYPQLFKEAENKRFLVSTPDNNLQLIIHQDNTDQYSLHFFNSPKSQSVSQEKLSPYFRNLKRIARSNVRIKYTPVNNALTFIHPEASVVITIDGFYSDSNKKAAISTMLSEKAIAVMSVVAELLSLDKGNDGVLDSDKGYFLEAYKGHYRFHPYPESFYSQSDYAPPAGSANSENETYEYPLGNTWQLSFLNSSQAVIRPVGDPYYGGEPEDGKSYQHSKGKSKASGGAKASQPSGSRQQGQRGSGAKGSAGASSGGGGKRPPRKKGEQKKHIPEDYNAPEQTAAEIDNDIQSFIQEIKETNERLASFSSQNRGAQEPAGTLPDAPEGATGGTGNRDNPATLRRKLQELNEKLRLARERKRELEMKTRATSDNSESNEPRPSTSRSEKFPKLGGRRFLEDDGNNPFE